MNLMGPTKPLGRGDQTPRIISCQATRVSIRLMRTQVFVAHSGLARLGAVSSTWLAVSGCARAVLELRGPHAVETILTLVLDNGASMFLHGARCPQSSSRQAVPSRPTLDLLKYKYGQRDHDVEATGTGGITASRRCP